MYMSEHVRHGKRARLVADLSANIRSGRLARGARLPGEHELAQRYQVSRGTVRGALSELQRDNLITTEGGVGSFVTFDGVELDQSVGWARAMAGTDVTVELLGIERGGPAELTSRFGPLVVVRRLRRTAQGRPVSLETAAVPGTGALADLPERGLVDGSLTATLAAAGLRGSGGEQWIGAAPLDDAAGALLERPPGELLLRATRTTLTSDGGLVEHVESLLDPARFRFHLRFGAS
ncbi:GntR family transcriptional regulator [Pseudonocardia sp. TRM90224]|uniref:GntR family transcriptional regulator n=1 Tax=Pseudonocardia sp. TRM90224 TaxID=2812678 RepID=UPI001E2D99EA|nr:GntR family transcriptional regulator [Pseudonocardia sp. TRM90224]